MFIFLCKLTKKEEPMYKKQFIFAIQIILFLLAVNFSSVSAETIILKSGKRIEGKIIEKTDQYIRIEIIEGVPVTYWLNEVERVEEEAPPTPQGAVPELPLDRSAIEEYINEASRYYLEGKYEDAISSLNKVIELDPYNEDISDFYVDLGILYYYLDRPKEAISSFQKAISLKSDNSDAYLFMGIVYDSIRQKTEAKENLSKALELFKEEPDVKGVLLVETFLKKMF